jgi:hypothetical protein
MKYLLAVIFSLVAFPAFADPVTIAVAALASAAGTAAAVYAGTLGSMTIMGYFAMNFAVTVGLSYLSSALTPKPKQAAFRTETGYQVAGIGPAQDHAIIYGQTRVGGVVVYKEATDNNKYLHLVVAIAGHECEEITSVYLNDEVLTLDGDGNATAPDKYDGYVRVIKHLGAADQEADATLIAESDGLWTSDHRLQGICYAYIRLEFNADSFPNGEPAISFLVKGKKVYDPNTATTAYSDNAALCLRDYLVSDYGLNTDDVDDTLFATAANICDETVALAAGGTEKRYTTNGSFTTGGQPKDVIDDLLRSMGGTIWYAQGKWRVKAAAYTTPVVSFDEDDLRSTIRISTRHSRRDNFNTVRGVFKGAESNYQSTDYPEVTSSTFINVDGGDKSVVDFDLGFTNTSSMAQRIAKIALYRNREQLTVSAAFGMKAFQVQVGDIIQLTNTRAGWTNKTFEVVDWRFSPQIDDALLINMDLREISSAVFDWDAEETAFEANNTVLADPFDVPAIGLAATSEARVINEHLTNVIIATVTSDAPERIDQIEVQYKKETDTDYRLAGFGELGVTEIIDVEDDVYNIRARAINTFGIKGAFSSLTQQVEGLAEPPADVENFSFNVSSAGIHLEWDAVPDLDLSFYRIRHAQTENGATFANATTAVDKVARPGNSVTVPPRSGTYLIKAYDKSGNQSVNATTVVVRADDLDVFTNTQTQIEHPSFSGTKTGCSVDGSSRLRITDPSTAPSSATYDFSNYIDTGSVRVARCLIEMELVRINDAPTDTFDTLTGLFDSLPGNFDDLTGGTDFADVNVIQYVSTTDDDPAGTPTWSAYKRFKSGDFSGRAFRFRVELQSTADDITPAIDELTAKVRYN